MEKSLFSRGIYLLSALAWVALVSVVGVASASPLPNGADRAAGNRLSSIGAYLATAGPCAQTGGTRA